MVLKPEFDPERPARPGVPFLSARSEDPGLTALREAVGEDLFAAASELGRFVAQGGKPKAADMERRRQVVTLACACLWAARSGSTRLPLGARNKGPLRDVLGELCVGSKERERLFDLLEPGRDVEAPLEVGAASVVLGRPGEFKPLLHTGQALCIQRLAVQEQALGERLRHRLAAAPAKRALPEVRQALADVLARPPEQRGHAVQLSDEQQRAMLAAAHQRLTVISGGPGTGKTSIIVSILRLLTRLGWPLESVALAAPTGKAANRMEEAITGYLRSLSRPSDEDRALLERRPAPTTLHRLLGYSPRADRFQHHAQNPLPHRMVIVDEASMIDLSLMDQVVRSVNDDAHLVLLGDAEQLPSVDAGAVLRDLVPAEVRPVARPWDGLVPGSAGAAKAEDLRDLGAVRLTKSYRMDERDVSGRAIYLTSLQVRQGQVPGVAEAKAAGQGAFEFGAPEALLTLRARAADVAWEKVQVLTAEGPERQAFLQRWFQERVVGALPNFAGRAQQPFVVRGGQAFSAAEVERLSDLDGCLQRARLLCLTRSATQPGGAAAINRVMEAMLKDEVREVARHRVGALLPGTPVLMTRNDYDLGLFNGDQGLAVLVRHEHEEEPLLRLVFRVRGEYRVFDAGTLAGQVEPCWAMTVHKSQGSEFEHVALVLPTEEEAKAGGGAEALACREVVYTAMTRARSSVTVLGTVARLEDAVGRSLERWSALGEEAAWRVG